MTDLEKLRSVLMGKITEIEKGNTVDAKQIDVLIQTSNSIIKSYNVELRADEVAIKAKEQGITITQHKVFKNEV